MTQITINRRKMLIQIQNGMLNLRIITVFVHYFDCIEVNWIEVDLLDRRPTFKCYSSSWIKKYKFSRRITLWLLWIIHSKFRWIPFQLHFDNDSMNFLQIYKFINFVRTLTSTTQNGCGHGISATPDLIEQYSPIISDKFFML